MENYHRRSLRSCCGSSKQSHVLEQLAIERGIQFSFSEKNSLSRGPNLNALSPLLAYCLAIFARRGGPPSSRFGGGVLTGALEKRELDIDWWGSRIEFTCSMEGSSLQPVYSCPVHYPDSIPNWHGSFQTNRLVVDLRIPVAETLGYCRIPDCASDPFVVEKLLGAVHCSAWALHSFARWRASYSGCSLAWTEHCCSSALAYPLSVGIHLDSDRDRQVLVADRDAHHTDQWCNGWLREDKLSAENRGQPPSCVKTILNSPFLLPMFESLFFSLSLSRFLLSPRRWREIVLRTSFSFPLSSSLDFFRKTMTFLFCVIQHTLLRSVFYSSSLSPRSTPSIAFRDFLFVSSTPRLCLPSFWQHCLCHTYFFFFFTIVVSCASPEGHRCFFSWTEWTASKKERESAFDRWTCLSHRPSPWVGYW